MNMYRNIIMHVYEYMCVYVCLYIFIHIMKNFLSETYNYANKSQQSFMRNKKIAYIK